LADPGAFITFLTDLLLTFGVFSIAAGAFTAYFGSGKSRKIGAALVVLGLVVLIMVAVMYLQNIGVPYNVDLLNDVVFPGLLHILGALVGAAVALVVFLIAIMKS